MQYISYLIIAASFLHFPYPLLSQKVPTSGLVAYYKFDYEPRLKSKVLKDYSPNGNDGKIVGVMDYVEDRFGVGCSAMNFDGNSYVTVPDSKSLKSPHDAFSVAVWFKLNTGCDLFKEWLTICCKSNQPVESNESPQYRMQATAQTVSINTEFTENFIPPLSYDIWYFYVYTYDGSSVRVFINGKLVFDYPYSGTFTENSMPLEIGRDLPGGTEFYNGVMDDLLVYNRSLSNNEIAGLFSVGSSVQNSRCDNPKNIIGPDSTVVVDTSHTPGNKNNTGTVKKYDDLPPKIGKDKVEYQNEITVKDTEVTIYPYDNEKEDGDVVSININGVWVRDHYELKNKKIKPQDPLMIRCSLNPGRNNYLVSKAWTLGSIPPNTLTIEVNDGHSVQKITLNSQIGISGGIRLVCEPQ
jgi:hypothetical protein